MFTKKQLYKLIIPLIIEQTLAVTVGMVDIIMVSSAGEAAISGVSLVDTLNILLINIFSALATGGAVVSAQYLGHKDNKRACKSGEQLLVTGTLISLVITLISLIGNKFILHTIYGDIDGQIMGNASTYFYLTALSFPFLAIYNSCAALFRAMGNSKVSMTVSWIMNIINVFGNAILIYGLRLGVAGVAIPTLVSRAVAAIIMLVLITNEKNPIHIKNFLAIRFDFAIIKRILHIGVPNGLENSMFQIGKIMVQGLIASFGMAAITGNAVANTFAGFETLPGGAISLAMITVIGQCVGANDYEQAKKYTIKLLKMAYGMMIVLNIVMLVFSNQLIGIYSLSAESEDIALQLLIYHSICCMLIWPTSFTLPNALRAANDVKFTMLTSIVSMWICRVVLSYVLGKNLGLGVLGVWIAMTCDWLFRTICFLYRFIKGKWKEHAFVA